jgi:hypothetical protein
MSEISEAGKIILALHDLPEIVQISAGHWVGKI